MPIDPKTLVETWPHATGVMKTFALMTTTISSSLTQPAIPNHRFSNELYARNMAALWRHDIELAQQIDDVSEDQWLEAQEARSGAMTACVTPAGGKATWLHSRHNPEAEGERLAAGVELEDKFCVVVFGFGLGYHVRELHTRLRGDGFIVAIEPSLSTLATAMGCVDLSEVIRSGKLIILTQLDKSILHERLKPFMTLMMLGAKFVAHQASHQINPAFYAQAREAVTDFIAYARMTLLTLVGNSEVTCRNIAYNLPTYASTPPIDVLRDRFKGYPGVVVSGGPSLRKNIELLSEVKGNGVLCAVQSLLKPLTRRGIKPDFVTSLDFHSISQQFFHGIEDFGDVHLIAEPKVNWQVLDLYKGPVSLLHSEFAERIIGPELGSRNGLPAGATVAHLAFYLLNYMGCDPIVFVGQDLAFSGNCFYVPGVETHHTWRSEINRFNSMETREWERIVRNRNILRKTRDVEGRDIYTDELLFTYLEQFERDFATCNATIINATEGGARMRGTQVMTLRDVIDEYCTRPLPENAFAYRDHATWNDASRLDDHKEQIATRIDEITNIRDVCDEMLGLLAELQELADEPVKFNRRLVRVDELRAIVNRAGRSYDIVTAATQRAELQRFTADRKLDASDATGIERARRQLDRDVRFVEAFREGVVRMIDILQETLRRFDQRAEAYRS